MIMIIEKEKMLFSTPVSSHVFASSLQRNSCCETIERDEEDKNPAIKFAKKNNL
jgi:hypothetical protein